LFFLLLLFLLSLPLKIKVVFGGSEGGKAIDCFEKKKLKTETGETPTLDLI